MVMELGPEANSIMVVYMDSLGKLTLNSKFRLLSSSRSLHVCSGYKLQVEQGAVP